MPIAALWTHHALMGALTVLALAVGVWCWSRLKKVRLQRNHRALRMRRARLKHAARPPQAAPGWRTPPEPGAPRRPTMAEEAPEYRPLVLVVDDSKAALVHAREILERGAYRVEVADNGRTAWALLQDHKPDLILSDIDMPVMTGLELLRLVREDLRLADLPFVLMTGNLFYHQSLPSPEADSLLSKPYRAEDLLSQVNYLLHH